MKRVFLTIVICLLGSILMPLSAASVNYVTEIAKAKEAHDYKEWGRLLAGRASTYYNAAMVDSLLLHVPEDLKTLAEIEQWNRYYETWTYLINTLIYYSNSKNKALREVQAMYDDAKKRNNKRGLGIAYFTMGNVYLNMNNLDESAQAYQKGLECMKKIDPLPPVIAELYSYYGDVLNEQKRFKELDELTVGWKEDIEKMIMDNEQLKEADREVLWFYYDIACVQAAIGLEDFARAQRTLDDAYRFVHSDGNYMSTTWLTSAAQLRLKQGRYMEALYLNSRRMSLVSPDEDKAIYLSVALQRADILSGLHRYEELSKLYERMYFVKDSLNSADTKNQLAEMNSILHVDELEREQEQLKMEQERLKMEQERDQFRSMMIIGGLILGAMVVFIVFRTIAARRLKKAHDQLQETHEELLTAYDQLEETTTAKERIESDLRIARNIQMGMVPRSFPSRPDLDLYGSMTPAKEVGGDLYGYYLAESSEEGKGDKLYFCLGDVSGKGVPASLFMAQATRLFCTLAAQEMMPAEIATRINNALSGEDNETGMFVTMFLGLLDLQTGHLDFCNAGHNPPVLLREGKPEFIEMVPNAPVGIIPELDYEGEEIADITNCPLFIYTDGLNEAENRQQEQFTDERLLEMMEQVPFESCQQTVEMLRDAVEKHRDGAEPNDDLTMLCVKFIKESNN
jgi:serine phosphatase RsbU (regulator of sigma subunit)